MSSSNSPSGKKYQAVLSVGGLDPSGGAGIISDCKVFEQFGKTGFGIATCITYQNDTEFDGVDWLNTTQITRQLHVLFRRADFVACKIGLVESEQSLLLIVDLLKKLNPEIFIVWDPIISASAGFRFHENGWRSALPQIMKKIDLITPNIPEAVEMGITIPPTFTETCDVLMKGGHSEGSDSVDVLWHNGKLCKLSAPRSVFGKHGSGCVLSSAIAAGYTNYQNIPHCIASAKQYVSAFLNSSNTNLGFHRTDHSTETLATK